jgi:hypothetical protein
VTVLKTHRWLTLFSLILSSFASAQGTPPPPLNASSPPVQNAFLRAQNFGAIGYRLSLGLGFEVQDYREWDQRGEPFMDYTVPMATTALQGNFSLNPVRLRLDATLAYGNGTYHGALVNPITGASTPVTNDERVLNFQAGGLILIGVNLPSLRTRVEVGTGYRGRMHRTFNLPDVTGDYDREITDHMLPFAVSVEVSPNQRVRVELTAEYRHLLAGQIRSYLDQALNFGTPTGPVVNRRTTGRGVSVELVASIAAGGARVRITPYYRFWQMERSDQAAWLLFLISEPTNVTQEAGITIGLELDHPVRPLSPENDPAPVENPQTNRQ